MIDTLSIAVSLTEDNQSDEHIVTLTESWSKLISLLNAFLDQDIDKNGGYLVELWHGRPEGGCNADSGTNSTIAERVIPYLSEAMSLLLASADREQATAMFQLIHGEVCI